MSQFPLWSHTRIRAAGAAGSKTHNLRELIFQEWSKLEKGETQGLGLHNIIVPHIRLLLEVCLRGNRRITFSSPSVKHILHHISRPPHFRAALQLLTL